jgi:hypothetical protein
MKTLRNKIKNLLWRTQFKKVKYSDKNNTFNEGRCTNCDAGNPKVECAEHYCPCRMDEQLKRRKWFIKKDKQKDIIKTKEIKRSFLIYFDGSYGIDPRPNTPNSYTMGVCKLEYKDDTLTVYLRRPGLLIGKGGQTIDEFSKWLNCKVKIVEVNLDK